MTTAIHHHQGLHAYLTSIIPALLAVVASVALVSLPLAQAGELTAKQLSIWNDKYRRPGATICVAGYVMDENRIDKGTLPSGEMALHRPNLYPLSNLVDDPDSTDSPFWILAKPAQGSMFYSKGWQIFNSDIVIDLAREVGNTFSCETCYGGGTVRRGFKIEASGMIMSAFPPKLEIHSVRVPDRTGRIPECAWFQSVAPTDHPTRPPTPRPTTGPPTLRPTPLPTNTPTLPQPTNSPTPPKPPSTSPTPFPTTLLPTPNPTLPPTTPAPTPNPTMPPTPFPTTRYPTPNPTKRPTEYPSPLPTPSPTEPPTRKPTPGPTHTPSLRPSAAPSGSPVGAPSMMPSFAPTETPPVNCSEYQKIFKVPNLPLWIHWVVNIDDKNSTKSTLSAQVVFDGQGWIGFGVSPTRQMNGSSVIVGSVEHTSDFVNPGKFYLGGRGTSFISVMEKQTLKDATIEQNATHTVMKFTKLLQEEGEPRINGRGRNTFIAAHGFNNQFAYHAGRIIFDMVLTPCIPPLPPFHFVKPAQPVQAIQSVQPVQEEEKPDLFDHLVYVNVTANDTATVNTTEDILTVEAPEAIMDKDPIPFEDYGGVAVGNGVGGVAVGNGVVAVGNAMIGRTSGGGGNGVPSDAFASSSSGRGEASEARATVSPSLFATASTLLGLAYLLVTAQA